MISYLPIVVGFEENETLYSWEYRMLKANLYDSREEFEEVFSRSNTLFRDDMGFSRGIFTAAGFNEKQIKIYEKQTLYPYFAPFFTKEKQEKYLFVQRHGLVDNSPISVLQSNVGDLHYCPVCANEDKVLHLHREHQLPGVNVCIWHGCKLKSIPFSHKRDEMTKIKVGSEGDYRVTKEEVDFALFQYKFMKEAFDLNKKELLKIINLRLKELYLNSPDDILKYFKDKNHEIPKTYGTYLYREPDKISEIFLEENLFYLFGNIDTFKQTYSYYLNSLKDSDDKDTNNKQDLSQDLIDLGYTLLSPYKKNLLEIKHSKCGNSFLITEYGLKDLKMKCPTCKRLNDKEVFETMFNTASNGEYELLSPYLGAKDKLKIKHKKCGHEFETLFSNFYYKQTRCPICSFKFTIDDAQKIVNQRNQGFKIIEFNGLKQKAKYKHEKCGHTFENTFAEIYRYKLKCPVCKKNKETESFKKVIKKLVGDEYELVGDYSDVVKIKHIPCGNIHEYIPSAFLRGARCPLCNGHFKTSDFEEYVFKKSCGKYKVLESKYKKDVKLINLHTNETLRLEKFLIIQELERPSKSKILPCEKRDFTIKREKSKANKLLNLIYKNFKKGASFRAKDFTQMGFKEKSARENLHRLRKRGILKRNSDGSFSMINYNP